jgi:hypothetical protein
MTSQVNPNNIDGTYPIAGQDNDSQGFRDNFTNIRNNLTYVKAEIEDLQSKALLKTALNNSTIDNDLSGNVILNPTLGSYREVYYNVGAVSSTTAINFLNGNFQKITLAGATTLSFTNFPSGKYASIKLWVNVTNISYTLTLPAAVSLGDPDTVAGWAANTITFNIAELLNNENYFFEFYTVDGGTTIGIRDLIRNRDLDLSGFGVIGNLSVDNITTLANIVTTNGIFWAANGNPFSIAGGGSGSFSTLTASSTIIGSGNIVAAANTASTSATTGALVVVGGAGIGGNVNVDGNLWVNSGNIRSTSTRANIFNVTATTISLGNAASFISMGAAGSNVLLNGGLTVVGNITTSANLITPYITSAIGSGGDITIEPDGTGDIYLGASTTSNVIIGATTTTTNTTTGALVVAGGTGIAGAAIVGGNLVAAATTVSTDTTTGALVVAGGVGVASNINIGGNLVTQGGRINQNYAIITLTNNQNYFANIQHQTQIFDTASSATIANARIAFPTPAIDGREINMSFLAPITALWINSGNTTLVRWMPNNTVSSGNVHVQFIYSAGLSTWVRTE